MNKTFVADLENHNVYLISNEKVSFYINVSKEKESTSITLDIKTKKKDNINSVINYYEKIDNYNITLVIPMMSFVENNTEFKKQSNAVSTLINHSYKLLTKNGINVKNNVKIIKHQKNSEFVDFFLNQFSNRVRYIPLDDLVHEEVPYNKINAANISFVVGKPELELTIKDDEIKEIINEVKEIKQTEKIKNTTSKLSLATSGYVSYYLLGFLTAVVTLLFLTLMIK